ncbi:MAG: DMT family protein [Desulfobulbaceae bacterium]|nr:DMT family protein [Desulfobulbaceae bacterium]
MRTVLISIGLLCCSNVFMTFAWYGHLKNLSNKPWIIAVLVSWGIALFEYLLQVPANRIGFQVMNLGQLKILQEVITLLIFIPFSVVFMKEEFRLDFLWAGLCVLGAVFFVFRQKMFGV